MHVRSDRRYRFDVPADRVWAAIAQVDDYRAWWPWLRRFEADRLVEGDRWRCTVRPPLPYALRFGVELVRIDAPTRIEASVTGDIRGQAEVTLAGTDTSTDVRLVSTLAPASGPLRAVAAVAPWLARFGHDWVLDTGLRQFRRRAL